MVKNLEHILIVEKKTGTINKFKIAPPLLLKLIVEFVQQIYLLVEPGHNSLMSGPILLVKKEMIQKRYLIDNP